jgi:hypothetical protein
MKGILGRLTRKSGFGPAVRHGDLRLVVLPAYGYDRTHSLIWFGAALTLRRQRTQRRQRQSAQTKPMPSEKEGYMTAAAMPTNDLLIAGLGDLAGRSGRALALASARRWASVVAAPLRRSRRRPGGVRDRSPTSAGLSSTTALNPGRHAPVKRPASAQVADAERVEENVRQGRERKG